VRLLATLGLPVRKRKSPRENAGNHREMSGVSSWEEGSGPKGSLAETALNTFWPEISTRFFQRRPARSELDGALLPGCEKERKRGGGKRNCRC